MKIIISILITIFSLQPSVSFSETVEKIWNKLKTGGFVVLMRHTTTVKENNPLLRDPLCVKERKLSDKGKKRRQESVKILLLKEWQSTKF